MRPTITQKEAEYITELLKTESARLEDLAKREYELKCDLTVLKHDLIKYRDPSIHYIKIPKVEQEIAAVWRELNKRPLSKFILNGLIVKYERLATGKLDKGGRPKAVVTFSLSLLER